MVRKIFFTLIVFLLIILLTGCWDHRELDMLAIVSGMAIDFDKETEGVKLTAQIIKAGEVGSPQSGGGNPGNRKEIDTVWVVESTGKTVFEAIRAFTFQSSRKLYFPHNEILIIGEEIARKGMSPYLNFFIKNHENRNSVLLAVAEGEAAEVLKVKTDLEKIPAFGISNLIEKRSVTSQAVEVNLQEFLTMILGKEPAAVTSYARIIKKEGEKKVFIKGAAVFKRDKFVGILNEKETRGLLWIRDKIESGILAVKGPEGNKVSLEITNSESKIKSVFANGKFVIKLKVYAETNLGENMGTCNLTKTSTISFLEKQQNRAIKEEINSVLNKALEYNTDIFGFGNKVYQDYPQEWSKLKSKQESLFSDFVVEIVVKSKIKEVGLIVKPSIPE